MIDVALIGLGPEWETRFRPALLNLRKRLRVRVVQSAVSSVAEQIATEWGCQPAGSLTSVFDRVDLRAVLILDTAWYGMVPVELALRRGKPAFLAGKLSDWANRAASLASLAALCETPVMPDFGHRYWPASSRLKELLATRLGRPDSIAVHIRRDGGPVGGEVPTRSDDEAPPGDLLVAIDWICHLVGTAPAQVRASGSKAVSQTTITFKRSAAGGAPATAQIVFHPASAPVAPWTAEIRCRRGIARLKSDSQIEWDTATDRHSETLLGERPSVDVMLDHFSRRVVGGLIPVGTLGDLDLAVRLAQAAGKSRETGQPVPIEAPP